MSRLGPPVQTRPWRWSRWFPFPAGVACRCERGGACGRPVGTIWVGIEFGCVARLLSLGLGRRGAHAAWGSALGRVQTPEPRLTSSCRHGVDLVPGKPSYTPKWAESRGPLSRRRQRREARALRECVTRRAWEVQGARWQAGPRQGGGASAELLGGRLQVVSPRVGFGRAQSPGRAPADAAGTGSGLTCRGRAAPGFAVLSGSPPVGRREGELCIPESGVSAGHVRRA